MAAATAHADHASALALFAALAACQIGWGLFALASDDRRVLLAGSLGNLLALGGWIAAKAWGIGFVHGLEHAEPAQLADSLAAGLAAIAVACAAVAGSRRGAAHRALGAVLAAPFAVILAAAAAAGVLAAPGHAHGDDARVAGAQHSAAEPGHGHRPAPRRAREDRAGMLDLSGVEGVTPAEQARAERLVAATRRRLPAFGRVAAAEAAGYVSIGDAMSGHEHYVKWSYIDDGRILDPRRAESLVYRVDGPNRNRTLVAAMYMLGEDATLDTVPDVGGRLTQWHVHDDLCFTDGSAPVVAGLTTPGGDCPPPLVKRARVPMLHVWIVRHECGPFAALDGIAGGQVRDGEQPRCHHAHGGR